MLNLHHAWLRVLLVARCSNKCPYCSTLNHPIGTRVNWLQHEEASGWLWGSFFKKQLSPEVEVVLTGGEPTLHKGFDELVNIDETRKFRIYSNAKKIDPLLSIKEPKRILIELSYHIGQQSREEFTEHYLTLSDMFPRLGMHMIKIPGQERKLKESLDWFNLNGIGVGLVDYTGMTAEGIVIGMPGQPHNMFNGSKTEVMCRPGMTGDNRESYWIVGPDGNVYSCVHHWAVRSEMHRLGNVFENPEVLEYTTSMFCKEYGACSICEFGRRIS